MTYEEAINIIDLAIAEVEWEYPMEYAAAFDVAKESLKKQIPKKPEHDDVCENIFYCPTCTRWFNGYHKPHHCKCGQALKFED